MLTGSTVEPPAGAADEWLFVAGRHGDEGAAGSGRVGADLHRCGHRPALRLSDYRFGGTGRYCVELVAFTRSAPPVVFWLSVSR